MGYVKVFDKKINNSMEKALYDTVLLLVDEVVKITPRDPARPPKDPTQKITGNLKRSIGYEKEGNLQYKIGSKQGQAEYGVHLEFGTVHMKPRSFIRKGIYENKQKAMRNFTKQFYRDFK